MSGEEDSKRVVHPTLKWILAKDVAVTKQFLTFSQKFTALRSLRTHHQALEISCHGIAWLFCCLGSVWLFGDKNMYQFQINLLIGLVLDIIVIGVMKAVARRRRPTASSSMGPDKYSFPSGHASRAALVLYILYFISPISIFCRPPLFAWLTAVSVSRVLAEKHYLLDIFAGITIGLLEGMVLSQIWVSESLAQCLVSSLTDETTTGSGYDV